MAYLAVLGCLGTALVELLGGEVDFNVVSSFVLDLEAELTLVLVNMKGLGGGGGGEAGALRGPIDPNKSFPVMSIFRIVLAVLETLRHMLDFWSSVLLWVRIASLWSGDLYNHVCHKFAKLFGSKSKCLSGLRLREGVLAYN